MSRSRRHSHSRVSRRRAAFKAGAPALIPCPRCKTLILSHRVCSTCGHYKGREIVPQEQPEKRKAKG
jgi:large subunit ribosomal protein L32